jgi:probable HAF family extracellular repeat protein
MRRCLLLSLAALAFVACEHVTEPKAQTDESLAVRPGTIPAGYELIELGSLGEGPSHAEAINAKGQIVGWSTVSGQTRAFLWQAGVMTDLNLPGKAVAYDISNTGLVTGWHGTGYQLRAFLWKRGLTQDLGALADDCGGFGRAVNNRGQVAGYSEILCGGGHAGGYSEDHSVFWDRLALVDLHTSEEFGRESRAMDINNRGQVVGYLGRGGQAGAAMWEDGQTILLGTPPAAYYPYGRAYGINDRGQIVGGCATAVEPGSHQTHGCLWEKGRALDLGWTGEAVAINNRGQVVGHRKYGEYGAVVWSHGTTTELPTPTGWASYAADINERGQIVGWIESQAPLGSWEPARAVLWQPDYK